MSIPDTRTILFYVAMHSDKILDKQRLLLSLPQTPRNAKVQEFSLRSYIEQLFFFSFDFPWNENIRFYESKFSCGI